MTPRPCLGVRRRHDYPAVVLDRPGLSRCCGVCGAEQVSALKAARPRAGLAVNYAAGLYRWRNV